MSDRHQRAPRGRALGLSLAVLALAAALLATPASAARGIDLGLTDSAFQDPDASVRRTWFDRATGARAETVLLGVSWGAVVVGGEPADPRNPADPGYAWGSVDAAVREATARGLEVAMFVGGSAPAWAEGRKRSGTAAPGTWKPSPAKLGDFGQAVATRFSGAFVDPLNPGAGALPRIRAYQLWAEPNLSVYLTPQWKGGVPVAPNHYRRMLNAFGKGVRAVHRDNLVVTGGTAPYGDPIRGGQRMPPVRFWREVLCLRGDELRPARCKPRARFDVLAHHPINVGRPERHARNPLDASTPDIGRVRTVLRRAERTGRAKGAQRHPIWATEVWWDSNPPDPDGVPAAMHARWLQEALYVLWKQRVKKVIWFLIRDQDGAGGFGASVQSGLFERDGDAKLAYQAFRFPFVAEREARRRVVVWGKAPAPGSVAIERRENGEWRSVASASAGTSRVFEKPIRLRGGAQLRARQGGETSLVWSLR